MRLLRSRKARGAHHRSRRSACRDITSLPPRDRRRTWTGFSKGCAFRWELLQHPLLSLFGLLYRAIRSGLSCSWRSARRTSTRKRAPSRPHFILHTGGTNTGEISFRFGLRQNQAGHLLLRSVCLRSKRKGRRDLGVACSLTTGEKRTPQGYIRSQRGARSLRLVRCGGDRQVPDDTPTGSAALPGRARSSACSRRRCISAPRPRRAIF